MDETNFSLLIRILSKLNRDLKQDSTISPRELEKAKAFAAKLYVAHTNRIITLEKDEFNTILSILELQ
ncbi:MAG: hypothetical protein OEZ01_12080 [Candidatus Heimdallarchaeota archaeon]|nr:hypothetical protein [Candidatus Heimdallarchaeota archaeon]MDH5646743.1 hypothetical protein [Candidatus Heimdallarchaeota archaeon]